MALLPERLIWYYGGGASNSDPDASLGGVRSSVTIHETESTFTSTTAIGEMDVYDTSLGGSDDDHNGKYLLVFSTVPGINMFASQIVDYRASDGRMILRDAPPAEILSGTTFRIFVQNSVFDDVSGSEAALGTPEYRGFYHRNEGGETFKQNAYYIQELGNPKGGPFTYEIWTHKVGGTGSYHAFADPNVGPNPVSLLAIDDEARFDDSKTFAVAKLNSPRVLASNPATLPNTLHRIIYLKRTVPVNTGVLPDHTAVLLVAEGFDNPETTQVKTGCIITFGSAGFTPQLATRNDRSAYIRGGFRAEATVIAQESGLPVPEYDVGFRLASGPGTLNLSFSGGQTDEDGKVFASYIAPTDQGQAGQVPSVEIRS